MTNEPFAAIERLNERGTSHCTDNPILSCGLMGRHKCVFCSIPHKQDQQRILFEVFEQLWL